MTGADHNAAAALWAGPEGFGRRVRDPLRLLPTRFHYGVRRGSGTVGRRGSIRRANGRRPRAEPAVRPEVQTSAELAVVDLRDSQRGARRQACGCPQIYLYSPPPYVVTHCIAGRLLTIYCSCCRIVVY